MLRERTITWEDPQVNKRDALSALSGLEYLTAVKEGRISPPPVAGLLGYRVAEIEKGRALFELDPDEYHYNPFGTVHGGIMSTLLDTAMTAAVLSTLPKGVSCSTMEIKVNFIRPISAATGTLRCTAEPIHIGKRMATVQARLHDGQGVLHAHGSSTCAIFKTA